MFSSNGINFELVIIHELKIIKFSKLLGRTEMIKKFLPFFKLFILFANFFEISKISEKSSFFLLLTEKINLPLVK